MTNFKSIYEHGILKRHPAKFNFINLQLFNYKMVYLTNIRSKNIIENF